VGIGNEIGEVRENEGFGGDGGCGRCWVGKVEYFEKEG
jgi:hypothetical protein